MRRDLRDPKSDLTDLQIGLERRLADILADILCLRRRRGFREVHRRPRVRKQQNRGRRRQGVNSERWQVGFFREEGYLIAEDILDVERDLEPVVDEYASLLGRMAAQWHAEGKLLSNHADLPFAER